PEAAPHGLVDRPMHVRGQEEEVDAEIERPYGNVIVTHEAQADGAHPEACTAQWETVREAWRHLAPIRRRCRGAHALESTSSSTQANDEGSATVRAAVTEFAVAAHVDLIPRDLPLP